VVLAPQTTPDSGRWRQGSMQRWGGALITLDGDLQNDLPTSPLLSWALWSRGLRLSQRLPPNQPPGMRRWQRLLPSKIANRLIAGSTGRTAPTIRAVSLKAYSRRGSGGRSQPLWLNCRQFSCRPLAFHRGAGSSTRWEGEPPRPPLRSSKVRHTIAPSGCLMDLLTGLVHEAILTRPMHSLWFFRRSGLPGCLGL